MPRTITQTPLFIILLGTVIFAMTPFSKSHADAPDTQKTVVVSIAAPGWPPYAILDGQKDSENRGIMLDVMHAVLERLGYGLKLESHPAKRVMMLLEDGEIDATLKAKEWVTDPDHFLWSNAILHSEDVLVSRIKSYTELETLIKHKGARVAGKLGFSYPSLQEAIEQKKIRWYTATTTENLLQMLRHGHVDAIVTNKLVVRWAVESSDEAQSTSFYYSPTPIATTPYRFAFARKEAMYPFVKLFNEELERLRKEGVIANIISKYQ
ncbi:conserved protein of unknown function [Pseudodesulfovibrio profundus]|uniref:Solute-binding protein family 3/N-terminal domain-containing protein n=1 Tax=Pseudodesulfovibrio profundus TaxID=57320 RepID=A0A2C8FBF5_9BACT|nr:transporter substrate-binding domain-containing protein [Pseudodesulfovibrio profundus]SOB59874.1 conserved protein of unknown function [Pseudodesulfovibrio profundus]